jgi:hypothetical protein
MLTLPIIIVTLLRIRLSTLLIRQWILMTFLIKQLLMLFILLIIRLWTYCNDIINYTIVDTVDCA